MNPITFTVRFLSEAYDFVPQYIGPFYTLEDAEDYADDKNYGLSLNGYTGETASYSVVY